jgi:Ni/Fe-hydrogenase 1 B-type cytochrome subunit
MSAAPKIVKAAEPPARVYIWELPVRITHWLIFFSILILAATGYYLGHPFIAVSGPPRNHFVMGTIRVIHLYTAIVFSLAVFVRVYWMFAGNRYARWSEMVPASRRRLHTLWQAIRFYTYVRRDPEPYLGHSGLAGLAYAIVFLIYFLMILTGLTLYTVYAPTGSPFQLFRFLIPVFGGLQGAHLLHHIGMWLLLIFVVHHVYSAVLFSFTQKSGIIDSIFSGYKRVVQTAEPGERDD